MNQQLFVGVSRAIRLPARRAMFVMQFHPSDWGYFIQADLTNPQLKWHFHLTLRSWEKALEDFSSSDDELVGGTKSNEDLLLQRLGRDWDSWLLHYSKHVGGSSRVFRSKRGAVTFLTPFGGEQAGLCHLCHMQHLLTVSPFPLRCFEVIGHVFLAGSGPSGEVALGSGNLKSVCSFLHLFHCGICGSFLPELSVPRTVTSSLPSWYWCSSEGTEERQVQFGGWSGWDQFLKPESS